MNTRLQVEHPVTEFVTGLDLVEQMIRIAAGETLSIGQEDVRLNGWAIEARIYAEDPGREFLPSIGKLVHYNPPTEDEFVRVDTGVREGSEIGIHYDPMIAKLIAGGDSRQAAADRLGDALDAFRIRGVSHNIGFLAALIDHPRFRDGALSTGFIAEEYPNGYDGGELPPGVSSRLSVVAAAAQRRYVEREASITGAFAGHEKSVPDCFVVLIGGEQRKVRVSPAPGGYDVEIDGTDMRLETGWRIGEPILHGSLDGEALTVQIERVGVDFRLYHRGVTQRVRVVSSRTAEFAARMPVKEAPDLSRYLLSPMPGLLSSLAVAPGQEVKPGDTLAVVEAMKMENILRAERAGIVRELHAAPGESLAVDQAILEFE
jgi:propionyl-CoA carboxylase alpha subunit